MKRRIYRTSKIKHKMDVFQIVLYVIVSLYVLSMISVLGFGLLNSFKAARDYQNNLFGLPRFKLDRNNNQIWGWRFDNYPIAFRMFRAPVMENGNVRDALVMEMFLNSLIYAVGLTVFTMASEIIMAYAIAKYDFKLKKFFYGVAVVVMLIPIIGSLASEVKFADALHLKDSFFGVFIMKCKFTGIYFLVFYAAFKSISCTYAEAAQKNHCAVQFRVIPQFQRSGGFRRRVGNDYSYEDIFSLGGEDACDGVFNTVRRVMERLSDSASVFPVQAHAFLRSVQNTVVNRPDRPCNQRRKTKPYDAPKTRGMLYGVHTHTYRVHNFQRQDNGQRNDGRHKRLKKR